MDKDGDLVTLTSREDVHSALGLVIEEYQRLLAAAQSQGGRGPKMQPAVAVPPLRLHAMAVAREVRAGGNGGGGRAGDRSRPRRSAGEAAPSCTN